MLLRCSLSAFSFLKSAKRGKTKVHAPAVKAAWVVVQKVPARSRHAKKKGVQNKNRTDICHATASFWIW